MKAVIPIIVENQTVPSTAAMARAAGVAEGTIFSVFPDKASVLHEAIKHSIDPGPTCEELRSVDAEASFKTQLSELGKILLERTDRMIALFHVLRTLPHDGAIGHEDAREALKRSNEMIVDTLTSIFETHSEKMVLDPGRMAIAFRGLVFASGHPAFGLGQTLTVEEIATVVSGTTALTKAEN